MQALLDKVDVNERNKRGTTPLMHAAWWGSIDAVQLLLTNGAEVNAQNLRKNTALHFAYEKGRRKIVALLEAAGAQQLVNGIGLRPLDMANEGIPVSLNEDGDDDGEEEDGDIDENDGGEDGVGVEGKPV